MSIARAKRPAPPQATIDPQQRLRDADPAFSAQQPRAGGAIGRDGIHGTSTLPPPQAAGPRPQVADEPQFSAFAQLLTIEAEARRLGSERELRFLLVNDARALVRARQIILLGRRSPSADFRIHSVSGLSMIDRDSPLLQCMEGLVRRMARECDTSRPQEFLHSAFCEPNDPVAGAYPFQNFLWIPLWSRDGSVLDGMLLTRETAWLESDRKIAVRLAETFGHALALLRAPRPRLRKHINRYPLVLAAALSIIALGFIPVPISALAPVEVSARDAHVVSMPADAIVEKVLVAPNETVTTGQPLVRLNDIEARSKLEVASREVAVAEAHHDQAHSLAFSDPKGRHELALARAELQLRMAERDYAQSLLQRLDIVAPSTGIAIYSDRKDLEGKPLTTGTPLMQIATPGQVELSIDLPVADSIVLQTGAKIRAFLDSDPLQSWPGELLHIDYQARRSGADVAVHRVTAMLLPNSRPVPQLGTRGTAQIIGPRSTLALYLFRRPLSALRQWLAL